MLRSREDGLIDYLHTYTHTHTAMFLYLSICPKIQSTDLYCSISEGLHNSLCLYDVRKPFVVASIALLLHTHTHVLYGLANGAELFLPL